MSTAEKLFVQIFDRKNSIIQQVKQQIDSYNQHLASKLLIDGISPPSWLLNPNQPPDVQKVLNKEELISEILLPRPQPAVHYTSSCCSLYNKPVVAGDNDEIQDIYNFNRRDTGDRLDFAASCHVNNTRSTVNSFPELDFSVNSPPDETEARISNIYTAPDQSLARIQRSRSRQKALELRYSGKAEAKSPSSKKNVFVGSSARRRQSFFGSEKVNKCSDSLDLIDPCVTRNESYRVGQSNKGGDRSKEKSTRLKNYAEEAISGVGSLELDSCSDNIQKNDSVLVQNDEEFTRSANPINELPELIKTSDAAADSCGEARGEDCCVQTEKGTNVSVDRTSQPSSSQQHICLNEGQEVGISIHSAEADGGTLADSVQQFDNANHYEQITKPSEDLGLEREKSETTSNEKVLPTVSNTYTLADQRDKMRDSSSPEKSVKVNGAHRTTSDKAIIHCPNTCNISHQQRNIDADNGKEIISHDLVKDPLVRFETNIENAGSDCLVSRSSDFLIFLEPKQLDFGYLEERNLDKCFSLNLGNRRLQKSPKNTFGTLLAPQITSENLNNTMPQKLSSVDPEISTDVEEVCRDSFESTSKEHVNLQLKEYSPHIDEHPMLEITQEDSEIVPRIQNSNFKQEIDTVQSSAFKRSDTEDHGKCYGKELCKSPTELQTLEGQHRTEGKSKSRSASTASKRKYSELDYNTGENDLVTCSLFKAPLGNHQNHDISKPEELKVGSGSQLAKMGSWPRTKSRRTEVQETASCSAPPGYSVRMHYHSQTDHKSKDFEKVDDDVETVMEDASPVNKSTDENVKQKVAFQLNEEMKLFTKQQNEESALCSGGLNETLADSNLQQVAVPIPDRVSEECLVQELETPADLENDYDEQDKVHGHVVNTEGLSCTEKTIVEGKSFLAVDSRLPNYLQQSPYKADLELMGVDQSLPELEGFIIDSHSESEEVEISGSHINFDELGLPRTSIERARILEKICKSASQQALSTQFSSSFKLYDSHKAYQSLPNGVLECIDLTRFEAFNKDVDEQFRSNFMDDANGSLRAPMHSDSLPNSGSEFGWGSHNSYGSPVVGKLWERMSSHTSSSGKTLGSNPELTCFPIEEDPSGSEENENVGEEFDKIQEDIVSSINASAKRESLSDITKGCLNAPSPAPVVDNFLSKDWGNSATNEANVCDFHSKAKRKVGNHIREKSLDKENSILSFVGNAVKKSEASLSSRFSKANSLYKTSSRKERKTLSEKEPKRNNIVSNVTSFIPLVQQKQAAAQCTGKRDVKVKALEAAEAAKRMEQKKADERKMRKEALKIERARLEQENLRHMELERKRKEEERKKKDADIVAKKRQREEEEKKEKGRKRKRLEEARQQQKNDGKLRSEKAKQLSVIGENDTKKKEACNESKRSQVSLKESRDNIPLEKPETKMRPNGFTSYVQDADISIEACRTSTDSGEHRKGLTAFDKSPKTNILAVEEINEKSYDISPYQCSDNEEEEEEEEEDIPEKKFIPSWARKSYVALALPLQQGINPNSIFPPDSFCSTEEVLHRRKPKNKRLAM